MTAQKEKDCLIKLFYQYLVLDESELGKSVLSRLDQIDGRLARQLVDCLPERVEADEHDGESSSRERVYTWPQLLYCLASALKSSDEEENRGVVLRRSLGVLVDHLGKEEGWEASWYGEYGESAEDAREGAGAALKKNNLDVIAEGISRILTGSAPGKVTGALKEAAELRGIVLYGISSALGKFLQESNVPHGGISQFLHNSESALIAAVDSFLEKGNIKSALKTLRCLQGDHKDAASYRNVLQRVAKYLPIACQSQLLEEVMGSSNARELSCILQEMLDTDLKQKILGDGVDENTDGGVLIIKRRLPDFQEARVMHWHVGEKQLQATVGDILRGNTKSFEKLLREDMSRMACMAALIAWDLVGSNKPDQVCAESCLTCSKKVFNTS